MANTSPVVSGKYGCAKQGADGGVEADSTALFEIIAWQYQEASQDVNYRSCQTDGNTRRIDGSYDITGSLTVVYNAENPIRDQLKPDDETILYLFKRKAMIGVTGIYDRIPAKILTMSNSVNIDQAGPIQIEITWGMHTTDEDPEATFDNVVAALAGS